MKRSTWITLAVVLIALVVVGVSLLYGRAVNLVSREIESAKARIERNGDGSVLEWSDYEVRGISVVVQDFHYYDAHEDYDIFADELTVSKRIGENYSGEFVGLRLRMGKYDVYEVENGHLVNFNAAEDIRDFVSETTVFNGFRWAVNDATPFILTMDRVELQELDHLKAKALIVDQMQADFETENFQLFSPRARIDDLIMLSSKKYFELDGILYTNFQIDDIIGTWYGKKVVEGYFDSNGELEGDTGVWQRANVDLQLNFDVEADFFREHALLNDNVNPESVKFFDSLGVENYQGIFKFVIELAQGENVSLSQIIDIKGLGKLAFGADFSGYSTQLINDIDRYQPGDPVPESFENFKLLRAGLIYDDEILADRFLNEYMRLDPALISFLVQMTFPEYLPQDPQLVRDLAKSLTVFLRNKNSFSIQFAPAAPLPVVDIVQIFRNGGPFQSSLGINVIGE